MKISKYFSMLIAGFVIIVFTTVGVASEEAKEATKSEATTEVEAAAKVESEAESKEEIQHGAKPESESGKKEAKAEEKE